MSSTTEVSARNGSRPVAHFEGLDAVRALAVVSVAFHHAVSISGVGASVVDVPASVLDWGLSVFFVLSGFLIYRPFVAANAAASPLPDTLSFYWRRFIRIFPAYWVAFFFFAYLGVNEFSGPRDFVSHLLLLHVFDPATLLNGFTQAWSLTVELMFYLLVPLWARLMSRWRKPGIEGYRREMIALGCLVAAAFAWRVVIYLVPWTMKGVDVSAIGFAWLPSQLDLLVYGMMIAATWTAVRNGVIEPTRFVSAVRSTGPMWALAAVILAVYAWGIGAPTFEEGYGLAQLQIRQVLYGAAAVAVILPFVFGDGLTTRFERVLGSRAVQGVGLVSYGIYLYHLEWMELIAREVAMPAGGSPLPDWLGTGAGDLNIWVMLVAAFGLGGICATASWFLLEKPMLSWKSLVTRTSRTPWASADERSRNRLAIGIVAFGLLLPLLGLMAYQGPPMEEGFMLVFPEQLLQGRLPHRDFLHLYGPGSLWVLAAVYKVFGVSLTVERLVGFAQHAVVVAAMFHLLRPFGRRVATFSSLVTMVILISPLGLSAMAWNGALAMAMAGLAFGAVAARNSDPDPARAAAPRGARHAWWRSPALWSGVCAGITLLYRPDLVIAVGAAFAVLLVTLSWPQRRQLVGGAVAMLALYVPHVLTSGLGRSVEGMFIEPVFELRGGRSLPIPPSFGELDGFLQRAGALRVVDWPLPMPPIPAQVSLWFWLVVASAPLVLLVCWWLRRTAPHRDPRIEAIWPASVFGAALITQALQRPDTAHLSWVSGITFSLAIPVGVLVLERWAPSMPTGRRIWIAIAPVAAILLLVIPFYPLRTYGDLVGQSFGYQRFGFEIERDGRRFYYGSEGAAQDAQKVVDSLDEQMRPGETLLVGTSDLSRTPYSDAFFYYLFPDLLPATRYIEMDPGIADAPDSGLAEDVRNADWVILSDAWSGWDEPNDSRLAGSDEPNGVIADEFCAVTETSTFVLLRPCT